MLSLEPGAPREQARNEEVRARARNRHNRLKQIEQAVNRALDGHHGLLIIEFHHDAEQHVTLKAFDRPGR